MDISTFCPSSENARKNMETARQWLKYFIMRRVNYRYNVTSVRLN